MAQKTFTYYSDAGHGWLKVPRNLLEKLQIADKITYYSYQKKDHVYLEEDCDASIFLKAFEEKTGQKPSISPRPSVNYSRIRAYNTYQKNS